MWFARENKTFDFAGLSYSCGCFTFILLVGGVRMYIGVTGKRYRAVKEVGKVNMSVGIIAYYQVMQVCQSDLNFYLKKAMLPTANQGDDNHMQIPLSSAFPSVLPPGRKNLGPFNAVEFQPSEICPQNFIIFDHTDNRSQIMFHPAIANKLSGPTANICSKYIQNDFCVNEEHYEDREISSPLMEDLDGIDALLSLEDEDLDESEDEEISTARSARSHLNYGNRSPDSSSSSTYSSKPRRKNQTFNPIQKSTSSSGSSCDGDMKQLKVKKMVRKLREILPGGYQMTTITVLDEAVKYLKSLKDEVQKLGVGGLEN